MVSIFDIFKIGIGPSSSHTVGPMRAAAAFLSHLEAHQKLVRTTRIKTELFGSLALTGRGHATDGAIILGLAGEDPETVHPDKIPQILEKIANEHRILLLGNHNIRFVQDDDLLFNVDERLPFHSNAMRFSAEDAMGNELDALTYYSIGGGFVISEHERESATPPDGSETCPPFPFRTADELLEIGRKNRLSIAEIVLENEKIHRQEDAIFRKLNIISNTMDDCTERGCRMEGILPGSLHLKRRAPQLYRDLLDSREKALRDPLTMLDWVSLWAMATSEENAAGGRVVTAPTNGAAGVIPAVLRYCKSFHATTDEHPIYNFLMTAGAIGALYKLNASISGAEVGCQGEVGVACSMAAAGLTAALGGSNEQIENAAEIGMEHNLGLTCDPVNGLVQIPCIERNAMGAVKAINASRLALRGDGKHVVSLDKVIKTMLQTGADMQTKYKETSEGGLAVNVVEC
ncbi:L-serine dehydratase, beta subunit (EC / L-serine dehydratase, alpha subunit (EC [Olavius algarvensis associated proteobacterium Delta 3]|nr:L-serine dehydratase, beta subunit (EC / L-serine dehydratase, alpha subunit (EC [Olavius algarvensis associated proteobacterium Delta 3]